jgi:pilus assembly protein Flp/PilA
MLQIKELPIRAYLRVVAAVDALGDALGEESGQELVEYALIIGLVTMGATVSIKALAATIGAGFTSIGTKLTTFTS